MRPDLETAVTYIRIRANLLERTSPAASFQLRGLADDLACLRGTSPIHPLDAEIRSILRTVEVERVGI